METSLQGSVLDGITQLGRWGHGNTQAGQCLEWHYTTREMMAWQHACRRVFEVALHNFGDDDMATILQASVWIGITQWVRWGHGNKPVGQCLNCHYTTREMRTRQQACRSVFEVALHSEGDEDMATSLQVSVWIGITQRGRWGHGNKPAGQYVTRHYITKEMRTWQQACRPVFELALHNEGDEDMVTSLQVSVWIGITQRGRWGHGNKPAGQCSNWHYTAREIWTWQQACRRAFELALHSEGDEDMVTSLQASVWIGIRQRVRWGHGNKHAGECLNWHHTARVMRK